MAIISIPENEMTSFDLPKTCIITGRSENVSFRPVQFQWYPRWIAALGIAPLIMIIVMMLMMRRAKGELPFSEEAWNAWKKGKMLMAVAVLGSMALIAAAIAAFANNLAPVGLVLILMAIAEPITMSILFLKGRGPVCQKIADGRVELRVPSDEAAEIFKRHIDGGRNRHVASAA